MTHQARVAITNPTGLHARPAIKLAQLAARYRAEVQVRVDDGPWVRARSTSRVMKLKARSGAMLEFRAEGEEAAGALQALVALVQRDFDEQHAEGTGGTGGKRRAAGAPTAVEALPEGRAFKAEVAAEGLARGVIHRLRHAPSRRRPRGSPAAEREVLVAAIDAAVAELRELAVAADTFGAQIITFQLELLSEDEFLAPAFTAIAGGAAAAEAWEGLLNAEIADYEAASDEYFRARASDLRDLRERVACHLEGNTEVAALPDGAILLLDELTPSRFLELDWRQLAGAVTFGGSANGHAAMLARARGVPLLIRLQGSPEAIETGTEAVLDAERGLLLLKPEAAEQEYYEERLAERERQLRISRRYLQRGARTADGTAVRIYLNVDDPALLCGVDPTHCDGIGLTRSEFLFRAGLPDEETQYRAYRELIEWARGRPVTIRTLDAGGDKPIPGLDQPQESNPFLGLRGIRLSLARPEAFRVQLRALARAAAHGPLKVMLPMVTLPAELAEADRLLRAEVQALRQAGQPAECPPLGMMVEVPAAALAVNDFAAGFYSIGSNDLVQYTLAAGRDSAEVATLLDPLHPGVLELITRVAGHGERQGVEVSVCGEMAARPDCLPALLAAGIRCLSVPPAALGRVKAALAGEDAAP